MTREQYVANLPRARAIQARLQRAGLPALDGEWLYAVRLDSRIKIGRSKNPRKRWEGILGADHSSEQPVVLLCLDGAGRWENFLHSHFEQYRVHGEWFEFTGWTDGAVAFEIRRLIRQWSAA